MRKSKKVRAQNAAYLVAGDYAAEDDYHGETVLIHKYGLIDAPLWWAHVWQLPEPMTLEQSELDATDSFFLSRTGCPHCGGSYGHSPAHHDGAMSWRCIVCRAELCLLYSVGFVILAEAGLMPDGTIAFLGERYTQGFWKKRQDAGFSSTENDRWREACNGLTTAWGDAVFPHARTVSLDFRSDPFGTQGEE